MCRDEALDIACDACCGLCVYVMCLCTSRTYYCLVHVAEEVEHGHMHSNVGVPLSSVNCMQEHVKASVS